MYAKSIIEHVRGRLAAGEWVQQLSLVPVVMALAVAALPFTLDSRVEAAAVTAATPGDDTVIGETPADSSMVKTAANLSARAMQEERRYAVVADYMARRFFVSRQVVLDFVKTAHVVGRQYNVDPTLLVAVIAVESSFNPIAESVVGAKGLMQILPQYHQEKFTEFGGEKAIFDPHANIAVGAKIIREYLQNASGDLFIAMQTYGGALPDRDASYTHKVLNEKDRLDTLLGLPKTHRSGRDLPPAAATPVKEPAPAPATEQPKERVQIVIPPPSVPAAETKLPDVPRAAQPVAPVASLPAPVAALHLP